MSRVRGGWGLVVRTLVMCPVLSAQAHDIPNARVDRSTQATLAPGVLRIDYEVSLGELTLTQDLRALIGTLPGSDRQGWFERYGRETLPLNAKGFLVEIDGRPVDMVPKTFDLFLDETHPRFLHHLEAAVPPRGALTILDTNYLSSEGTSRLAIRPAGPVRIEGDDLPGDVESIPIRPVWMLSDPEERRTKRVSVTYRPADAVTVAPPLPTAATPPRPAPTSSNRRLTALLDGGHGPWAWVGLLALAFGLGIAHTLQPGHGKTLVAAASLGPEGSRGRSVALALVTATVHTGIVLVLAAFLWQTRFARYESLNRELAWASGFLVAAVGVYRLGRHLGGWEEGHRHPAGNRTRSVLGLGLAGGLVPCWDAIALLLMADALDRLALGVVLVVAFGLGMAVVLAAVGILSARLGRTLESGARRRRLGLAASLVLIALGLTLMATA